MCEGRRLLPVSIGRIISDRLILCGGGGVDPSTFSIQGMRPSHVAMNHDLAITTSHHVTSHHVTSHHVTSHHITTKTVLNCNPYMPSNQPTLTNTHTHAHTRVARGLP